MLKQAISVLASISADPEQSANAVEASRAVAVLQKVLAGVLVMIRYLVFMWPFSEWIVCTVR